MRHEHFTNRGHLPVTCYNETAYVEFAPVTSQNEAKMYELYYIEKYQPMYNQADIGGGAFSFELKELEWQVFDRHSDKNSKTKKEIMHLVSAFNQEIETECRYAAQMLQGKDAFEWLDKLNYEERNEYLRIIYSLERFVQGIAKRNTKIKQEIG